MVDLQGMMDTISEISKKDRGKYHLTLGDLIAKLTDIEYNDGGELLVKFEDGSYPCSPDSYRGYYSDLAFSSREEPITLTGLLSDAEECLGKTLTGYKGGDFTMAAGTPLWRAEYSELGPAIMSVNHIGDDIILITKEVD